MATLKQIADDIAASIGKAGDREVIDRLKSHIIQERSFYYRRSIDKNGVDAVFKHKYIIDLITVSSLYTNIEFSGFEGSILRSKYKIPTPLRYKAPNPFIFVGGINLKNPFVYSEGWELNFASHLPLIDNSKVVRYCYVNGYIYLDKSDLSDFIDDTTENNLAVIAVYENPFLSYNREDNESGIHYDDDMEFPIPYDLLNALKESIVSSNFAQDKRYRPYPRQQPLENE
jgi:hypothetical protein